MYDRTYYHLVEEENMVASLDKFIDRGMYSLAEAAMYAKTTPSSIGRWLWSGKGHRATMPREVTSDEKLVTFVDFIQCLTVRQARNQQHVSLQRLREAVEHLHTVYKIDFPFARKHKLFAFEGDVVYQDPKHGDIFVSGKEKRQILMHPIIQNHILRLSFDDEGIAESFTIFQQYEIKIVMKARSQFGEPLMPSGIPARALWDAVRIEGGYARAAKAYKTSEQEVRVAFDFIDDLTRT